MQGLFQIYICEDSLINYSYDYTNTKGLYGTKYIFFTLLQLELLLLVTVESVVASVFGFQN